MLDSIVNLKGRFLSGLLLLCWFYTNQALELSLLIGEERWLYREYDVFNDELDREQGWLSSYETSAKLDVTNNSNIYLLYGYQNDPLQYVGATQEGKYHETVTHEKTHKNIATWRIYHEGLYIGLGGVYQSWDREIQANNGVKHLYEYYRWYGPVFEIGFLKQWDDIRVDFTAAASSLSGDLVVDLTHVDLNKPKLHLKSGLGYEAVIQISYSLTERWLLHAKHQQGYRYFPATDYVTDRRGFKHITLNEPESKNYYHGFWLGVGYQF